MTIKTKGGNTVYAKQYYNPKTLNGRVNILSFKLCHRYCIKCLEFGITDNDQRCINCKEQYTYNYLAYVNRFNGSCVPYDQMYDDEKKELKFCNTTTYKFYYNTSRNNERFCFKYDYECPDVYHYLNTTNNECLDYNPPTTILEKPTTIVTEKPTTIITEKPTTIVTEKPTTIITQKPTTILTEKPTTIITEKPTTIITEKPTTIVTQKPTTIITEKPTTIIEPITTEKQIDTTIIKDQDPCAILNKLIEARGNVTNKDLYEEFYKEILSKYSLDGNSVTCKAKDDHELQVTTPSQEINDLKNNTTQPIIDLSGCEVGLKKSNGIDGNNSLILYKYYKDAKLAKEKEVQFEVYEPINYTKLNLRF